MSSLQVRSFNFLAATYQHLASQFYRACVRRERGYCEVGCTALSVYCKAVKGWVDPERGHGQLPADAAGGQAERLQHGGELQGGQPWQHRQSHGTNAAVGIHTGIRWGLDLIPVSQAQPVILCMLPVYRALLLPDYVRIPGGSNGGLGGCTTATGATPSVDRYCGGTLTCVRGTDDTSTIIT